MASPFSNLRQDLETYDNDCSSQGFWVMIVYRFGQWRYTLHPRLLRKPFSFLYKFLYKMIQILTGIELPCETKVGKGFKIEHFGGIIISGYAEFGDHCRIRQNVTVGLRHVEQPCAPQVGNHVDIGAGAQLLGDITIGDSSTIGANAVVHQDVPPHSIAVGIPARVLPKS